MELRATFMFCSLFLCVTVWLLLQKNLYYVMVKLGYLACVFTVRVLWLIYCVIFYDFYWLRLTRVPPGLVIHL